MNRVIFIIDGFNLYHSVKAAQSSQRNKSTKWLDLSKLCSAHLYHFGKDAVLHQIYYISALAHHLEAYKPDITKRHQDYVRCLKSTGVTTLMNRSIS